MVRHEAKLLGAAVYTNDVGLNFAEGRTKIKIKTTLTFSKWGMVFNATFNNECYSVCQQCWFNFR